MIVAQNGRLRTYAVPQSQPLSYENITLKRKKIHTSMGKQEESSQ